MSRFFALLASKQNSSRDAVINLLSERFPLSVKEIHSSLARSYGCSVSYQAVHKLLISLLEDGVLVRFGVKYQLDRNWVKKVKNFGEHLDRLYSSGPKIKKFSSGEVVNLSFEKFADFGRFVIFTFHDQFPNPENKAGVYFLAHAWATAGFDAPEVNKLREVYAKTPHYLLSRSKTVLDEYFAPIYRALGKHCFLGVASPFEGEIMVSGDYVCQPFYTSEFRKKFDSFYTKIKSVEKLNLVDFLELYYEKLPVRVMLTKNPELADSLRQWVFELEKKEAKKVVLRKSK